MKKIIFIQPNMYNFGGIARVNNFLANQLYATGLYKVIMISLTRRGQDFFYPIAEGIQIIDLSFADFNIRKDFIKAGIELKKLFDNDFEGTFVIDDVGHTIPAWLGLRHCKKAKFICWSHVNFFNGSKYGFSGIGKRLAVKKFDYLIVLTKEDRDYYKKILPSEKVVQIYNPEDSGIVKNPYNIYSKKIISCGRLNKIKGFDLLLEVAKDIFKEIKDWTWDIYGEGPERDSLQVKIHEYGLDDKVRLMGYNNDILNIYSEYAFCVFTSRAEGCPLAMIEAMSAGLPMISFDFKCGPKDLIIDGFNGYIIKEWNLEHMKDRILKLINDDNLRKQFSDNSDCNLSELELSYVLEQWKKIL